MGQRLLALEAMQFTDLNLGRSLGVRAGLMNVANHSVTMELDKHTTCQSRRRRYFFLAIIVEVLNSKRLQVIIFRGTRFFSARAEQQIVRIQRRNSRFRR